VAKLCRDISFVIDPPMIVIGGGSRLCRRVVAEIKRHLNELIPNPQHRYSPSVNKRKKRGIVGISRIARNLTYRRKEEYAMTVKRYLLVPLPAAHYAPPKCLDAEVTVLGWPGVALKKLRLRQRRTV